MFLSEHATATFKSPIEFRKRNTTTALTLDASRFKCLPVDEENAREGAVMVFIGSPTNNRKDVFPLSRLRANRQLTEDAATKKEPTEDQRRKRVPIEILLKDDEQEFEKMISTVLEGLEENPPEMCQEGLNGTYFMKDKDGNVVAIFKPQDEEGNSANNPKKSDPSSFEDKGILDGEGALREVAAYLLDKETQFAGVPKTTLVRIKHPAFGSNEDGDCVTKTGSLQEFVENDGASWDIGFNVFPVHEVQKIGIFDLRIFNNDRHGGNMLIKKLNGTYKLTPIDHGFSLPSTLNRAWFDWLTWPQAKEPFSKEAKEYIAQIDVEKDVETLKPLNIRPECLRTMKISTMLLKKGCEKGLTLFDIGNLVSRAILEEPSEFELMYERALKEVGFANAEETTKRGGERQLLNALARIMDEELPKRK